MTFEAKNFIEPTDVEWEMDWSQTKPDGTRQYPDKPEKEMVFEEEDALAHLLINEVVFVNSHHWRDDWKPEDRKLISVHVNCNDVFAWGCADAEDLPHGQIEPLYRLWKAHGGVGAELWCLIQRKEMPQRPVAASIRKAGIDLDAFQKEHGLRANYYDGVSHVLADHKYRVYCEWERSRGREPRPFDKDWWAGWREYETSHPGWYSKDWQVEDDRLANEFRVSNGFVPNT